MAEKLRAVTGGKVARAIANDYADFLSPIEEVIEDIRAGRMVILIDDEDRENEGDLVCAAEKATPETVNFMARFGRGLVCLALTRNRIETLGLRLMAQHNETRHSTAFTVSIEAREGVTTGISASDRARTIEVAIDETKDARDIVTPGHVFPLVARDGGVLERAGHTEAAVDIARLAGLNPSGVICEIMNDDGTMARLPDLVAFAQFHGLKVATIADLIAYRLRNDSLVERVIETTMRRAHGGEFRLLIYVNKVSGAEHVVLVKGDISGSEPVLVRMHALNILDDLLHDQESDHTGEIESAIRIIGEAGRGVVVLIRERLDDYFTEQILARRPKLRKTLSTKPQMEREEPPSPPVLRDYGVGAQILLDLGVRDMILLTNVNRQIVGLEGYGLRVSGRRPIPLIDV